MSMGVGTELIWQWQLSSRSIHDNYGSSGLVSCVSCKALILIGQWLVVLHRLSVMYYRPRHAYCHGYSFTDTYCQIPIHGIVIQESENDSSIHSMMLP